MVSTFDHRPVRLHGEYPSSNIAMVLTVLAVLVEAYEQQSPPVLFIRTYAEPEDNWGITQEVLEALAQDGDPRYA